MKPFSEVFAAKERLHSFQLPSGFLPVDDNDTPGVSTQPWKGVVEHNQGIVRLTNALDLLRAEDGSRPEARKHPPRVQSLCHQIYNNALLHCGYDDRLMSSLIGASRSVGGIFRHHSIETPGWGAYICKSE